MKVAVMVAASVAIHGGLAVGLARMPRPQPPAPRSVVEMVVAARPAPPPPPPPPETPPPAAAPAVPQAVKRAAGRRVRPALPAAPAGETAAVAVPEAPPEPLDFTDGPALGGAPDRGPATPAAPAGVGRRKEVAPAVDQSRPPAAPSLDDALARNYPAAARAAGKTGRAVVRARIEPDGRSVVLEVLQASDPAFGAACRSTLDGSRWKPSLDAGGRPVAREISYTCVFEVGGA